jgi:hypothetical protein
MFYKLNFISKHLTLYFVVFLCNFQLFLCKVNGQPKMVFANHIIAYL